MMAQIYPWHSEQWQYFHRLLNNEALPHAILLAGPTGVGKVSFANALCASIVCERRSKDELACGTCKYCQLFNANTYPDYTHIYPEELDTAITVDDIRLLIDRLTLTRHYKNWAISTL